MALNTPPTINNTENSSHATTPYDGWSSQRIALAALLCAACALSTLMLEFPIMPGITWLKYDPASAIALVVGLIFDPMMALIVSCVPYLVHLTTQTGFFGALMAVISCASLVMPTCMIYKHIHTRTGLILAIAVGNVVCLGACLAANIVITPIYTGAPLEAVMGMMVPVLIPFNIIKLIINDVLAIMLVKPLARAFKRDENLSI